MIETLIYFVSIMILSFSTGILVKYTDYLEDTKKENKKITLLIFGLIYASLICLTVYFFPIIAPIAIGTILGLTLIGKIDRISHRIAVVISIIILLILIPKISILLTIFFIIINIAEEVVNDYFDKHKLKNKRLQNFSVSRPLLEISAFIVSFALGKFEIWVAIFFFDIAYQIVTKYENKKLKEKLNKKRKK